MVVGGCRSFLLLVTTKPYNNISKKCNLCMNENFFIICKKELCLRWPTTVTAITNTSRQN